LKVDIAIETNPARRFKNELALIPFDIVSQVFTIVKVAGRGSQAKTLFWKKRSMGNIDGLCRLERIKNSAISGCS